MTELTADNSLSFLAQLSDSNLEKDTRDSEISSILRSNSSEENTEESGDATILFWTLIFVIGLLFFWIFVITITPEDAIKIIDSMRDHNLQVAINK